MIPSVLVPFTTGVEEIEVVAVVNILRRAEVNVCMASLNGKSVSGRSGIIIQPDQSLAAAASKTWDMLVLPGGLPNADLLAQNPLVKKLATTMLENKQYIAAICAAPKALANFGLLANRRVTSHPSVQEDILKHDSSIIYSEDAVVHDGCIITSRGAGTAVSFALALAAVLKSKETANQIQTAILA